MMDNLKFDDGKPQLTLVPSQIIYDIAAVREFGVKKYKDRDSWRKVSIQRYRDALMRHIYAYLAEPDGTDEESGLTHLSHVACNVAFLCELEKHKQEFKVDDAVEQAFRQGMMCHD